VLDVRDVAGRPRADAFLVFERAPHLFVRLVGWLRFVWSAAFGGHGVLVLRGDDGKIRAPRVLLDWESYSTLLLLARPETLPARTDCSPEASEMGGSFG
jgi:hypothetical protein